MKNKSLGMLVVVMLLLVLMAVVVNVFLGKAKEDFPNDITVKESGVTESIMEMRDLKLNPTESKEYEVNLFCAASGEYDITLDYEELADGGMKPFVDVTVTVGEEKIYEGRLEELLSEGMTVEFVGVLEAKDPLTVTFNYLMPYDIGNEAQGPYSDFDVHIKIKKT